MAVRCKTEAFKYVQPVWKIRGVGGCLAVMAQWQSTGGSSQRCPGFDSRRLLAFSLSSIYPQKKTKFLYALRMRKTTKHGFFPYGENFSGWPLTEFWGHILKGCLIISSVRHDALSRLIFINQHFRSLVCLSKAKETNSQLCTGTYLPSGICHTAQQAVASYYSFYLHMHADSIHLSLARLGDTKPTWETWMELQSS